MSKQDIRKAASRARSLQPNPEVVSLAITNRLLALPQYRSASLVGWYIDVRDEVRTRQALAAELAEGKDVCVPYCVGDTLSLFRLRSMDELEPAAFSVMEPRDELRHLKSRIVQVDELDLVVVPGVAFDRGGGRLGYGKGYYDRLLWDVSDKTLRVGLAFECQIFDQIPAEQHDVSMDQIITERGVYEVTDRSRKSPSSLL